MDWPMPMLILAARARLLRRRFRWKMQDAAPVILGAPAQEWRTLFRRALVPHRPVSPKIPVQFAQFLDSVLRQPPGGRIFSRSQRLLPEHEFARLGGHPRGKIKF